jgi:GDP-L-fucose synthase
MKALATLIAKICDYTGDILWDSTKPDGQPRRALDGGRARTLLGWAPETTLMDGLEETVSWYQKERKEKGKKV